MHQKLQSGRFFLFLRKDAFFIRFCRMTPTVRYYAVGFFINQKLNIV